jgi:hypothetical protein
MNNKAIHTQPPSEIDEKLIEKFAEDIAGQNKLMDDLAKQLLTIELAIPGLYATALKLVYGSNAKLTNSTPLMITFICWVLALLFTLACLMPRNWKVDVECMRQDKNSQSTVIGIEDYFYKPARYKYWLILFACVMFFIGVCSAPLVIL